MIQPNILSEKISLYCFTSLTLGVKPLVLLHWISNVHLAIEVTVPIQKLNHIKQISHISAVATHPENMKIASYVTLVFIILHLYILYI